MAVGELAGELEVPERRESSPWRDALDQFAQNRVAIVSAVFIIVLVLVAILADVIAPYHFADQTFVDNYAAPGSQYLLGADFLGRDILSRTIYGARVSLSVAFVAATVSLVIGVVYGLAAGFLGGTVDDVMMRIVDILYGFPYLIFVILLQVYFKALSRRGGGGGLLGTIAEPLIRIDSQFGGLFFLFIALGALNWIGMARIARGQVLQYKEMEFVEAARMVGAQRIRIMFRHLLPNILGPCVVAESLSIPGYIFTEAFLSFIGLGVNAPTPSWGMMINEGYRTMRAHSHVLWPPAIALVLTVLAFNFLGDGLRDAFDPRLRGTFG